MKYTKAVAALKPIWVALWQPEQLERMQVMWNEDHSDCPSPEDCLRNPDVCERDETPLRPEGQRGVPGLPLGRD